MRTYYTAVGNFRRKRDRAGQAYPVIIVNRQEYMVDRQDDIEHAQQVIQRLEVGVAAAGYNQPMDLQPLQAVLKSAGDVGVQRLLQLHRTQPCRSMDLPGEGQAEKGCGLLPPLWRNC